MKRPSAPRTMRSTLMASASSTTPRRKTKARSWLASLYAEGKAGPYTINRCLDDYIADYKRRGGKALDRLEITADAFVRPLVNACEPAFRPLVQCALLTGCRYGEIVDFRAGDFDRDAGTVSVRASKAGRPRHVVLTDDGVALFDRHRAGKSGTALVFTRSDAVRWGKSH